MKHRRIPRYQGKISSWKDDQGFGFISPNGGGPAVFVHITSFAERATRPVIGDIVTFELGANEKGQPRAERAALARTAAPARPRPSGASAGGSLVAALGFLVLLAGLVAVDTAPASILLLYLGASAVTFVAYAHDKSAARRQRRRIPERELHTLAFVGGWPGALLAQQLLRHKSKKESFRTVASLVVALNCAALGWLLASSDPVAAQLRNWL